MALACLLAVAAGLRIWIANFQPNLIWADEIYQVVEPAHRLVYGTGLTAWEYVVGMRSWLFPGVVAGVLWLGHLFGSDPAFKLIPVQLFMVLCSLIPVAVAYRWGERLDGVRGGVIVGGFVALWVDLLYMAPHPLSDVIAADILTAGLYAAFPLTTNPSPRRLMLAGFLFGLAFVLRLQLGPALLVAAIFACGRVAGSWRALILGGIAALLLAGLLDWITLGAPFRSVWLNLWLNIAKGVSSDYGTAPAFYFLVAPILFWGLVPAIAVAAQFAIGSRRFPALAVVVATLFLTQSLIAHKEWRFIFPALPLLITLCGMAAIQEIHDLHRKWSSAPSPKILAGAVLAIWACLSLAAALMPSYRKHWTLRSELVKAFALAARQPGLCAVDVVDTIWIETPGSAALPTGVPIYANRDRDVPRDHAGYNVAISRAPLPGFQKLACFQGSADMKGVYQKTACVWRRDGGCASGVASPPTVNWPPFFTDAKGKPRQDRIQAYLPGAR